MCNALDMCDSYRITHLVHELGALHDVLKRARIEGERRRIKVARQRISVKLIDIQCTVLEHRVTQPLFYCNTSGEYVDK